MDSACHSGCNELKCLNANDGAKYYDLPSGDHLIRLDRSFYWINCYTFAALTVHNLDFNRLANWPFG